MSTDDGYWTGYYAGREEAETRDLDFDTLAAERNAARREADHLRARLAAVEALEPTWHRGMYGCPDDMFSRRSLRAALTTPRETDEMPEEGDQ